MYLTVLLTLFVANCVILSLSFVANFITWITCLNYCLSNDRMLGIVYVLSSTAFGTIGAVGAIFLWKSSKCRTEVKKNFIITMTASACVYTVVTTILIIFSLCFHVNAECFSSIGEKIPFIIVWIIQIMTFLSNGVLLLMTYKSGESTSFIMESPHSTAQILPTA